jgi:hypothetical protein
MKEHILLQGDYASLLIDVLRMPYSGSPGGNDSEWIECDVAVTCKGFGGTIRGNLGISELQLMRDQAKSLLSGKMEPVRFEATEAFLEYSIAANKRGSFDVHVKLALYDESELQVNYDIAALGHEMLSNFVKSIDGALTTRGDKGAP